MHRFGMADFPRLNRPFKAARKPKENWREGQQIPKQAGYSPHPIAAEAAHAEADLPNVPPVDSSVVEHTAMVEITRQSTKRKSTRSYPSMGRTSGQRSRPRFSTSNQRCGGKGQGRLALPMHQIRLQGAYMRAREEEMKTASISGGRLESGGQSRNRTTDTRIFNPREIPFFANSSTLIEIQQHLTNPCQMVVSARLQKSEY